MKSPRILQFSSLLASVFVSLVASARASEPISFEAGFQNPPVQARLHAYWWWLNGNVTKAAITRDLEWMKSIGMGGALIFDAGGPAGPVPVGPLYGSPQWRALFKHTLNEASRLGLEMTMSIQSGWNLGGPCVTDDEAGKHVAWSESEFAGPVHIDKPLPMPRHSEGYYRDSFVLAYRLKEPLRRAVPKLDASSAQKGHPASEAFGGSTARPIRNLRAKSLFDELGGSAPDCSLLLTDLPNQPGEEDLAANSAIDLSSHLGKDGVLHWDAPAGTWQVLRFGYTGNGGRVSTSSGAWKGKVVDYLDANAIKSYWRQVVAPLIAAAGSLAGTTLVGIQTDSWEGGGLNWTPRLPDEFRKRRGYDLIPYLPVLTGRIVGNRDASNRFLADFRKTIAECMAENHYGVMAALAREHGMFIHCEASGPHAGPFDGLLNYSHCERPMGEFWVKSPHRPTEQSRFFMKCASCAAHIYGKQIACGEGFTSIGPHWNDTLWSSQKPTFDHEACAGLNLVYWHAFTCSPLEMGMPGQEYFAGTHFNPNLTWAGQAHAFVSYLNRCQFLLQQGLFVADVCHYSGDHVPNIVGRKQADPAGVLPEYDYDVFNEEVLLTRMSVKDGRIVLPDGMSYRVMSLPSFKILSLPALRKIASLVGEGATVIGPKPDRTASLTGGSESDAEFQKLVAELWGGGRIRETTTKETLGRLGVRPDFEAPTGNALNFIHRRVGDAEIYFISNPSAQPVTVSATFRVAGKQPELWDAVSGSKRDLPEFASTADGRTCIPLEFGPNGSAFVIFRKNASGNPAGVNFPKAKQIGELSGEWSVTFDPKWGGPEKAVVFDRLVDWTQRPEEGIHYYSGIATYRKNFETTPDGARVSLDLGVVDQIAEVRLNGSKLGVLWCPPFRVEITGSLRAGRNELEIDVVNTWYNRLAFERDMPQKKRLTKTNVRLPVGAKPLSSGLIGPVTLMATEK